LEPVASKLLGLETADALDPIVRVSLVAGAVMRDMVDGLVQKDQMAMAIECVQAVQLDEMGNGQDED
jgi:hypothetical protein